jgi:hypothetical protein
MEWEYICRYCQTVVGTVDASKVTEKQLGLDRLTPEERKDIITSNINGKQQVRIICETCQQTIDKNPDLLLEPYLFH